MSYDYSENILVQEAAGQLLRDELAYNIEVLGKTETLSFDRNGKFNYC